MARHLVQAHGADAERLTGYAPTLEQLHFAHADTHLALAGISGLPPDRHAHPLPINAGWWEERKQSFRPFQRAPEARDDPFPFPAPHHTGLPHTWVVPAAEADLADWEAGRPSDGLRPEAIKLSAALAAAAWTARANFAGPAPAWSSARPHHGGARPPQTHSRRPVRGR